MGGTSLGCSNRESCEGPAAREIVSLQGKMRFMWKRAADDERRGKCLHSYVLQPAGHPSVGAFSLSLLFSPLRYMTCCTTRNLTIVEQELLLLPWSIDDK